MKLIETIGATSRIWQIFIADSSSTTGAGLTGLVYNSGSLTAYYYREGAASATSITRQMKWPAQLSSWWCLKLLGK